jgi:hypothetical protein
VWRDELGFSRTVLVRGAIQLLVALLFATRDILFLQWCRLSRMRAPILKGCLFLGLYYAAMIVISAMLGVHSGDHARIFYSLFTHGGVLNDDVHGFEFPRSVFVGIGIQLGFIVLLMVAIAAKLRPGAKLSPVSTG